MIPIPSFLLRTCSQWQTAHNGVCIDWYFTAYANNPTSDSWMREISVNNPLAPYPESVYWGGLNEDAD